MNALEQAEAEIARLRAAAKELCEAAFDYHVYSELNPNVEGVDKTVRLLQARGDVLALIDPANSSHEAHCYCRMNTTGQMCCCQCGAIYGSNYRITYDNSALSGASAQGPDIK